MGTQLPLPQRGRAPQFSAHFYCGQTAVCTEMPLGMDVGLSPGDFVRWRPSPPPQKSGGAPIFGPCILRSNGCMDQDATWYGGRPRPRRHGLDGTQLPSPKRGRSPLPNFRLMSIVAKQLDGSRWYLAWRWPLVQATLC